MNLHPLRFPLIVSVAFALAAAVHAAEPAIIAKARAYLGTEAALEAVRSVHYVGTVLTSDPVDPAKQTKALIEIIAQKPDQQRVVATTDKAIETTVVAGYEGWQRNQDTLDPKRQRVVVFKPDAVKRLRAQAWENLSFFRGIEKMGGHIEDQGAVTVDGLNCQKLAFIYTPNVIFYRFFDVATGRLVQTLTEDGSSTREEGETVINGVRFPKRMQMTMKGPKGVSQNVVVTLDTITVNETFSPEIFRTPSPTSP